MRITTVTFLQLFKLLKGRFNSGRVWLKSRHKCHPLYVRTQASRDEHPIFDYPICSWPRPMMKQKGTERLNNSSDITQPGDSALLCFGAYTPFLPTRKERGKERSFRSEGGSHFNSGCWNNNYKLERIYRAPLTSSSLRVRARTVCGREGGFISTNCHVLALEFSNYLRSAWWLIIFPLLRHGMQLQLKIKRSAYNFID